ncbi:uncharacterized protein UMAG_12025 [Mycosarcoma maydis]|uniref:Atos-like conserved domain-containing protein n=1 Tax=Mycosarcoma maydis TaxID=5270 RepID=A0A0D1DP26_MYCMD|nr:uncharacterized protein UMAG_12025 [Ustilago maydis 521]KIS66199.1 hypothetical protein UMAG_12025 [Ustilago maydis 521]|eukprot:XP_011392347.1 hypothetical protein UMAG_12025 [Ustilago maydis 521]
MSFYSAFPTSPLSRSALASEAVVERESTPRTQTRRSNACASITSPLGYGAAPRLNSVTLNSDGDRFDPMLPSPPEPSRFFHSAALPSRHVSGPARLLRNPFTRPFRSPTQNNPFDDGYDAYAVSPPMSSSSFTRSIDTRRRSSGFSISASSPTPNFGSLVGSFQESLLRGRMSMPASKPLIFDAEIGVLGMGRCKPSLRCPPHVHVKFPAHFYDLHASDKPASVLNSGSTAALGSPYVGTIDLEAHYHNLLVTSRLEALGANGPVASADQADLPPFPGYAVPPKGQIQLIVKYPDYNAVKLFLVPYDLTDMLPGTKTFVRQTTVSRPRSESNSATADSKEESQLGNRSSSNIVRATPTKEALRFAIHLQFCCPPTKVQHDDHQAGFDGSASRRFRPRDDAGRNTARNSSSPHCSRRAQTGKPSKIFLHKSIRLVFAARALDSNEKLFDQVETPGKGPQRFSTYNGPDDEWHQLHHEAKAARLSADQCKAPLPAHSSICASELGLHAQQSIHNGLGIAIHGTAPHAARSGGDSASLHESVAPLNSDPNGERWQPSSPFAHQSAISPSPAASVLLPATAAWSLSSHESSFGAPATRWPHSVPADQQDVHQLARSLASTRLTEALAPPQDVKTPASEPAIQISEPAASGQLATRATEGAGASSMQHFRPAVSACARPSRMRAASTASLSEARVQSVSALGRLEEAEIVVTQSNSVSVDSAFSRRSLRPTRTAVGDRPDLIRKLSEQFARGFTPSPTASPMVRPTTALRQADDELVEISIDNASGVGGCDSAGGRGRARAAAMAFDPHSTRPLRNDVCHMYVFPD